MINEDRLYKFLRDYCFPKKEEELQYFLTKLKLIFEK